MAACMHMHFGRRGHMAVHFPAWGLHTCFRRRSHGRTPPAGGYIQAFSPAAVVQRPRNSRRGRGLHTRLRNHTAASRHWGARMLRVCQRHSLQSKIRCIGSTRTLDPFHSPPNSLQHCKYLGAPSARGAIPWRVDDAPGWPGEVCCGRRKNRLWSIVAGPVLPSRSVDAFVRRAFVMGNAYMTGLARRSTLLRCPLSQCTAPTLSTSRPSYLLSCRARLLQVCPVLHLPDPEEPHRA